MNINDLKEVLFKNYSKDLCYPKVQDKWSEENKCFGMCAITSLIVNDYLGGDICKIKVNDISHYFNLINQQIIDLTSSQFKDKIDYSSYKIIEKEQILTEDTKNRYLILKEKVIKDLLKSVDEEIFNCNLCNSLVEKFSNKTTVFLGKNNDIVLVGEAPANNGWRKSFQLWKDVNGKVLPSGIILQKLFDIINRNIFETTFLEAVKCYPVARKNLKYCASNCKNYMLEQISILNPKLIITLGEFPTKKLLNFKFDKFSDVVGKIYQIGNYKILPIYHPSPISPKSYQGNLPIFNKISKELNIL